MIDYEKAKLVMVELGWEPSHEISNTIVFYPVDRFSEVAAILLNKEDLEQRGVFKILYKRDLVLPALNVTDFVSEYPSLTRSFTVGYNFSHDRYLSSYPL